MKCIFDEVLGEYELRVTKHDRASSIQAGSGKRFCTPNGGSAWGR
jgi:hypothetical protein